MNRMHLGLSVSLLGLLAGTVGAQAPLPTFQHTGMCDASAAVAVANDEDNVLRIYRSERGGGPVASFPLDDFLGVEPEHPEADIEGAAPACDRILIWYFEHV